MAQGTKQEANIVKRKKKILKVKAALAAAALTIGMIGGVIGYNLDDIIEKIKLSNLAELKLELLLTNEGYNDYFDVVEGTKYLKYENGEIVLPSDASMEMLALADKIEDKAKEIYDEKNGKGAYERDKEILKQNDAAKEDKRK